MRQPGEDVRQDATRTQAAIVRTLSQELDRLDPESDAASDIRRQLEEESARLAFLLRQMGAAEALRDEKKRAEWPARAASERAQAEDCQADDSADRKERPRVLVVDDNDATRTAIARWLSEAYDVSTARDGAEALEQASAWPPDAVVADVWMPRVDGIAMVRQMKTIESLRPVPVLFLTGQTSAASVDAGISAGAVAYLEKPIDLDFLMRQLQAALHGPRASG